MGKFLLFALITCGVCAAVLFIPVNGRTFWSRAVDRGIPQAAAREVAHGLRAGWDWVVAGSQKPSAPPHGTPKPTRRSPPKAVARAPVKPGASQRGRDTTLDPAQPQLAGRDTMVEPAAPHRAGRDGIVAQPPAESLQEKERAALDRLISARNAH